MPIAEVRDALDEHGAERVRICSSSNAANTNTRYSIDTSEQSVDRVKEIIQKTFGDKLMTYSVEFKDLKPFTTGDCYGHRGHGDRQRRPGVRRGRWHQLRRTPRAAPQRPGGDWSRYGAADAQRSPAIARAARPGFKDWTVQLTGLDADAARSGSGALADRHACHAPVPDGQQDRRPRVERHAEQGRVGHCRQPDWRQ